jgi:hypothetical protein
MVTKDPEGDDFIVKTISKDPNISGSLDEVAKELIRQPNPPGKTTPAKFPTIVPPAEPDPDTPDAAIDAALSIKVYGNTEFKNIYGAPAIPESTGPKPVKPGPNPVEPAPKPVEPGPKPVEPASNPVEPEPKPVEPAPEPKPVERDHIFARAVAAIALMGAFGVIEANPQIEETPGTLREVQRQVALTAAAASIAGLGAYGAIENDVEKKRKEAAAAAEEEAEVKRKAAEKEEAKHKYELSKAAAAIAGIASAGVIVRDDEIVAPLKEEKEEVESPDVKPVPVEEVHAVVQPEEPSNLKDEDFAWDSLYTKWMQIIRTQQYEKEAAEDIMKDEDNEDTSKIGPIGTTRAGFETMLKDANKGKDVSGFDPKYKTKEVYQSINKWVTKWKELGGAIRTFISFKTGPDEEAKTGDPYKVTTADLLINKVISKKIPEIINTEKMKEVFTQFVTWINTANPNGGENMNALIDEFGKRNISLFALTSTPDKNMEIVNGYKEVDEAAGTGDDVKTENKRKRRNQKVIICKLLLLKLLSSTAKDIKLPENIERFYNSTQFFNDTITTLTDLSYPESDRNAIIENLKDISDVQFNQMFVHYSAKRRETPILPKLLLDAFPYTTKSSSDGGGLGLGGGSLAPVDDDLTNSDLKDVLYGKFYSVWDSSVVGNQARYENGKFDSLIKILKDGGNVVLFGYGYSGSGKTYTLTNEDAANRDDWGIGPKLVQSFLTKIDGTTYSASVEELYCADIVYSKLHGFGYSKLLETLNDPKYRPNNIISYPNNNVPESNELPKLMDMMKTVKKMRLDAGRIKATVNNSESSRGHLFYTIKFADNAGKKYGNLVICDMGGRENPIEMAKQTYIVVSGKHIGCLAKKIRKDTYSIWQKKVGAPGPRPIYTSTQITITSPATHVIGVTLDTEEPSNTTFLPHTIMNAFQLFEVNTPESIEKYIKTHGNNIDYKNNYEIKNTVIDFFIACKEGFFINETINHLTAYINYLSMMGDTLISNKIMPTAISGMPGWRSLETNARYDPTHFIQDPIKVILNREKSIEAVFNQQSINDIRKVALVKANPAQKVLDITEGQKDFFGIITKLFDLKRPQEQSSSIICVMACIRTSHTDSSDSYRLATGRTLNFAISVSASNPALKEISMKLISKGSSTGSKPTGTATTLTLVGPAKYTAKAVAEFVGEGSLTRSTSNSRIFKNRKNPLDRKGWETLLDEYLNSDEYNKWEKFYMDKNREPPLDKTIIKTNFRPHQPSHGGTRRKRKLSGGNKKTRRIRTRK